MKIMQVITLCGLGGAQSVVVNLANELCKEHDVIVVSGEGDGRMWKSLDPRVKCERVPSLQRALSITKDIRTLLILRSLYRKYKPDVIQLHSSKAGMLGRMVFPRKKTIYTVHGFDSIRLAYRKYLPIERKMQRRCSSIVGVSKYDCVNLINEKINKRITCVYNGINAVKEPSNPSFDVSDCFQKKVLCIARLSPQKNCDLFLRVAEVLPKYAFIWIGNQHEVANHPKNVFFMGNRENAGEYNHLVDLFMLPSNYEGLPMVIIEAMSAGKPVVASDVGGISEIVENDKTGYVVSNNVEDFADKIRYILEDDDVCKQFSKNAMARFEHDLTVEKMVEGYMPLYNSCKNS